MQEERQDIVGKLRKIGHPDALRKFFSLANELVEYLQLSTHDPRLVFHLRKDNSLGILLNFFTALRLSKNKGLGIELIFLERDATWVANLNPRISIEPMAESNGFVQAKINWEDKHLLDDTRLLASWQTAMEEALSRATHSPKRKHHAPFLYELAVNENLRTEVIWETSQPFGQNAAPTFVAETVASYELKRPDFPKNQLFVGAPGTGKTYRALQLARPYAHALITFHPSFDYHEFVEGIRPEVQHGQVHYTVREGFFLAQCRKALQLAGYDSFAACLADTPEQRAATLAKAPPFIVIIDELNRGNTASIFGELITLIEPAKRLGEADETWLQLPYSQREVGVPTNLYIIGTLNATDRSTSLLDVALRRRFHFIHCETNYDLLAREVNGIWLDKLLRTLNERISYYLGPTYEIGHAYLMPVGSFADLCHIMALQIIPLLQTYFFNDFQKIRSVLGDDVPTKQVAFLLEIPNKFRPISGEDTWQPDATPTYYRLNPTLLDASFPPEGYDLG